MGFPRVQFSVRRIVAVVATTAVLIGFGCCLAHQALAMIQIAFAEEQTAIFEQMRKSTAESAAVEVGYLEYTLGYYPSGSKQSRGSRLDRMVERARQSAIREIIAILRSRTGKDFGDDPRRWIDGLRGTGGPI